MRLFGVSEFIEPINVKYLLYTSLPLFGVGAGFNANALGPDVFDAMGEAPYREALYREDMPQHNHALWLFASAMFALLGLRRRAKIG